MKDADGMCRSQRTRGLNRDLYNLAKLYSNYKFLDKPLSIWITTSSLLETGIGTH